MSRKTSALAGAPLAVRWGAPVVALVAFAVFLGGASGAGASASPGGSIAFAYGYPDNPVNWSMSKVDADTGLVTRLTPALGQDTNPAWSNDGSRLAFTRSGELWVMNDDGSDSRALNDPATGHIQGYVGDWSPDGKISFWNPLDGKIWNIDPDTLEMAVVSPGQASTPRWSPDGQALAFLTASPDGESQQMHIYEPATGQDEVILSSNWVLRYDWFPNSQWLAVWSRPGKIDVVSRDGQVSTPLAFDANSLNHGPSVSADGRSIAVTKAPCTPVCQPNVVVYHIDTNVTQQLTHFTNTAQMSETAWWGPDAASDPTTTDTDGDGMVDSSDPSPYAPYVDPNTTDADGDGITDATDLDPNTVSTGFSDGTGTTGSVTANPSGLTITVADAPAPEGVQVSVGPGSGQVTLTVCGGFTIRLNPGTTLSLTCGSVRLDVATGQAQVLLGDGTTVVTVPAGAEAKVTDSGGGSYAVENLAGAPTVTVDGVTSAIAPGSTTTVATWDFVGFAQPVDNNGVLNKVKAGHAIPLKWRLLDTDGSPVTSLASATITVKSLNCALGSTVDQIEETAPGGSGLQNLGGGYYQLNWKTPTSYANSCKTMQLDLKDGAPHNALFQFTK